MNKSLSVNVNYKLSNLTLPGGTSADHTVDALINYAFNKQWLTSTILQYANSTSGDFAGLYFRLNYIFRADDDFFLIYNEGRQLGGSQQGQKDRTLLAKFTYSFDF